MEVLAVGDDEERLIEGGGVGAMVVNYLRWGIFDEWFGDGVPLILMIFLCRLLVDDDNGERNLGTECLLPVIPFPSRSTTAFRSNPSTLQ